MRANYKFIYLIILWTVSMIIGLELITLKKEKKWKKEKKEMRE